MQLIPELAWRARDDARARIDPRMVALLREVRARGTLRAATAVRGMSYRNAWALLGEHARMLGAPLVLLERGRGARLAPLGERLLEADDALHRLLEREGAQFSVLVEPDGVARAARLRVVASHDPLLAEWASTSGLPVDLSFRGSVESLTAFVRGEAELCGFHVLDAEYATTVQGLQARRDRLIRFVRREQGLVVRAGNPKRLRTLGDVARRGARFVNRQRGSGTRLLVDALLGAEGIDASAMNGYGEEEFTHLAVASSVAAGRADAGVGVRAAALRFKLDFVPLAHERYWFAVRRRALRDARVQRLLAALGDGSLGRLAGQLGGYDAAG
ncbi:MAG: substrate-binding domain-containing protein, partial [Burkholderiales bacterium]|nr:substrate-binding domain-containing protein [Burkholderiales bacterium]